MLKVTLLNTKSLRFNDRSSNIHVTVSVSEAPVQLILAGFFAVAFEMSTIEIPKTRNWQ